VLRILFDEIAPALKERNGGYTRIIRLDNRQGDAGQRAILEWTDYVSAATAAPATTENAAETGKPASTGTESK
jgi:large subunit ribosomal protein L17